MNSIIALDVCNASSLGFNNTALPMGDDNIGHTTYLLLTHTHTCSHTHTHARVHAHTHMHTHTRTHTHTHTLTHIHTSTHTHTHIHSIYTPKQTNTEHIPYVAK